MMKNQKFCFIFAATIFGVMFVCCDKNDVATVDSGIGISTTAADDVASLNNLYEDLQTKSIEFLTNYMEERVKNNDEKQVGLRTSNLNSITTQQIITKEYVDPYFVEKTVAGISTVEYKGNFNFQTLINDPRLTLADREMIMVAYTNIEKYLPPQPFLPNGLLAQYCLDRYQWELLQISFYYFTINLMTIAPMINTFLANQWNAMLGATLVTNNHYNDITAAGRRYNNCLGK